MAPQGTQEFSQSKRGRILALHDENYTYRKIAEKIGDCTASAVWKTVKREEVHHTAKSLPRAGRPHAIDERTQRHVLRDIRLNRFNPYRKIANDLGIVTERQVQAVLKANGYHTEF